MTALRRVAGGLLLLVAVLAGAGAAVVTLLLVAGATGVRVVAVLAALATAVAAAAALAVPAAKALGGARRVAVVSAPAVAVVVVGGLLAWLLVAPVPRALPAAGWPDVRHWELPTGSRIAYAHTPPASAARPEPVVLVHGGPGAPAAPRPELARDLASAGFHVYDYHQLGAGLSSRLADVRGYTVERHVADLEAIRTTLGAERLMLVGASWGGKLIAAYLAAHPDRVAAAVVDSPSALWAPAFSQPLTPAGRADQDAAVAAHPRFAVAHALARSAGPRAAHTLLPDARMDGVFADFVGSLDRRPGCAPAPPEGGDPPRGFGFWVNAMTTIDAETVADPRPALRTATAPVLVLRAECDYIAWEVTREYRDVLPAATLVAVDGSGHTVTTDRPDLHRQLVRAHLLGEPLPRAAYDGAAPPWG